MDAARFHTIPRRQWLIGLGRQLLLASLSLLVMLLVARRRSSSACLRQVPACPDCRLLVHCRLPAAARTRAGQETAT